MPVAYRYGLILRGFWAQAEAVLWDFRTFATA